MVALHNQMYFMAVIPSGFHLRIIAELQEATVNYFFPFSIPRQHKHCELLKLNPALLTDLRI